MDNKPFDLASLDTHTLSEAGVPMKMIHPRNRAPVVRSDGALVTITLLGRASDTYRAARRRIEERQAEQAARGIVPTREEQERDDIETLVSCTKDWTIEQMDGQPFPFSEANARLLWSDKRFPWLRNQAIAHMQDDGNFLAS